MTLESLMITDAGSGARARILPGLGFNCYSFHWRGNGGPARSKLCGRRPILPPGRPNHRIAAFR